MARTSIRFSLTTSLLALVGLLSLAILAVNVVAGRRIADDLSARYLEETERLVEERLHGFFAPVISGIGNARAWARAGAIDPHDPARSTAVLLTVLRAHPQVTSLATGDEAGYGYRIGAEGDDFLVRVNEAGKPGAPARFAVVSKDGVEVKRYEKADEYDPRKRPWYASAREALAKAGSAAAAEVAWTDPFLLNTSKTPGISASAPFEGPDGATYMTTFNVMLTRLSDFTASLRPTPHGAAVVLSDAGEVLGFPATERYPTAESRLAFLKALEKRNPTLAEMGAPAVADAQATFDRAKVEGARVTSRYDAGGAPWRAAFRPYTLGTKRLWIGVAIPEADFLGEVERQRHTILWVSGGALLLAVVLALGLGRVYARPLGLLAAESDRITALDLAPGPAVRSHLREVHRLAESQERMRGALDSFAKYVPTPVVRELLRQGEAARLGGRVRPITVLFTDIRGFTGVSEGMTPAALTALLADYFARAMAAIDAAGGAVDKMIGDAIMALFGAPVASDDHAARAVRAALACDRALTAYEAECRAAGKPPLVTHFGLASGEAFVGNVGSRDRLNFTALGDVVNLASRLEGACKVYGTRILCADAVRRAAGDTFAWRLVDVVAVKGRATGERVHEPLGLAVEVPPARLAAARAYEAAFEAYLARRFDDALDRLAALAPDPSVARLRAACAAFRASPPPPDWDGVARLVEK